MPYKLTRISESADGTFGVLYDPQGKQLCVTCEPSVGAPHPCIPPATYHCVPHSGAEWKNVWEVSSVPGRGGILIHAGNTELDTLGCIVVGESYGCLNARLAVIDSDVTLNRLRAALPQEFDLQIVNNFILN